jgi:hypothetical protein
MAQKDPLTRGIAVVALVLFAVAVLYMMHYVSEEEKEWSRRVYVFGALEAIAFAAAGFFFGKDVNRERAETAEDEAVEATAKATEATAKGAAAGARLDSLVTVIDQKKATRTRAPRVVDRLTSFATEHGADASLPELRSYITAHGHTFGSAVGDDDWDELARVAHNLAGSPMP